MRVGGRWSGSRHQIMWGVGSRQGADQGSKRFIGGCPGNRAVVRELHGVVGGGGGGGSGWLVLWEWRRMLSPNHSHCRAGK